MSGAPTPPAPWYRHFWPWFVVGLLGVSVTSSLATVVIAVRGRDPEVGDAWIREAVAVRRADQPERRAASLGVGAAIALGDRGRSLQLELWADRDLEPARLDLRLVHPTLASRDHAFVLERAPDGRYRGHSEQPIEGRFQLMVQPPSDPGAPPEDAAWRLAADVRFEPGAAVDIGAPRGAAR